MKQGIPPWHSTLSSVLFSSFFLFIIADTGDFSSSSVLYLMASKQTQTRSASSPEMSPKWPQSRLRGFTRGYCRKEGSKASLRCEPEFLISTFTNQVFLCQFLYKRYSHLTHLFPGQIIPYKVLKTEYKPYEAKRRLLGNFDMFISDDRIRRLLPSHLGKHFYERKK